MKSKKKLFINTFNKNVTYLPDKMSKWNQNRIFDLKNTHRYDNIVFFFYLTSLKQLVLFQTRHNPNTFLLFKTYI